MDVPNQTSGLCPQGTENTEYNIVSLRSHDLLFFYSVDGEISESCQKIVMRTVVRRGVPEGLQVHVKDNFSNFSLFELFIDSDLWTHGSSFCDVQCLYSGALLSEGFVRSYRIKDESGQ